MIFADRLSQGDDSAEIRELLDDPKVSKVRVHDDVLDQASSLSFEDEDKMRRVSKFTCWPAYDTWIEWCYEGLDMGFYFHGADTKSVLVGTGLCMLWPRDSKNGYLQMVPVRYDLENYTLSAMDMGSYLTRRMEKLNQNDPSVQYVKKMLNLKPVDPIALAIQHAPLLNMVKPLLISVLAFMNSPKIVRTIPVDKQKLNARRLKRGKYPYHPHHEVRLNIDKHILKITEGQGDGPERCLHSVRAHLRFLVHPRYKNVSVVLVPPHTRGNPELGIMNTSYAVDRENSKWPA